MAHVACGLSELAVRGDHGNLSTNQICRQRRKAVVLTVGPSIFDYDVLAFDVTGFVETRPERGQVLGVRVGRCAVEKPNYRDRRLLRACCEWPRRRAAEQRDEVASFHSITSSARSRNASGIVRPSALAVVKLMTRSNLVGCSYRQRARMLVKIFHGTKPCRHSGGAICSLRGGHQLKGR